MTKLFLGIDCSTQSLTGIVIDSNSTKIITKIIINYDKDLSHFRTQNGVHISEDEKVVYSTPLMWVEALDLLFEKLLKSNVPIKNIKAISGSGQQHGTVYLNSKFQPILKKLNPLMPLAKQLREVFSREISPVWMDSSTSQQCSEIRDSLGGLEATIKLTGSNTFERFSGPQIRKFYQENPKKYDSTATIHLISSFMSSLLLGKNSPIDHGDGAGMNLMNITTKKWDNKALNATAPNLTQKLPSLTESSKIVGEISSYYVERYGFSPETNIIVWSGDNPNSLIGVGIIDPGKVAISLGTSDTYFSYMKSLSFDLSGESHVFGAPTGDYIGLICFKNGSLAREAIRDHFHLNWNDFSKILKITPPGNNGKIMLPYFYPEIVPLILEPNVYRFGFDENDLEANVRGIIEAQFLSMRLHSQWIKDKPTEIIATGGGSENREILQVVADIFNTKVIISRISDSAALGATLRSAKSYYDNIGTNIKWSEIMKKWEIVPSSKSILPKDGVCQLYSDMLSLYSKYEDFVLKKGENPEAMRKKFKNKYFSTNQT